MIHESMDVVIIGAFQWLIVLLQLFFTTWTLGYVSEDGTRRETNDIRVVHNNVH